MDYKSNIEKCESEPVAEVWGESSLLPGQANQGVGLCLGGLTHHQSVFTKDHLSQT